ncbi:hypothetical protein MBLNU457_3536t1 [Dothideomycetes sp. NU457]
MPSTTEQDVYKLGRVVKRGACRFFTESRPGILGANRYLRMRGIPMHYASNEFKGEIDLVMGPRDESVASPITYRVMLQALVIMPLIIMVSRESVVFNVAARIGDYAMDIHKLHLNFKNADRPSLTGLAEYMRLFIEDKCLAPYTKSARV